MQNRRNYDPKPKKTKNVFDVTVSDDASDEKETVEDVNPDPKPKRHNRKTTVIKDWDSVNTFSSFGIGDDTGFLNGTKVSLDTIINKEIFVTDYAIDRSKFHDKDTNKRGECLRLQFLYRGESPGQEKVTFTGSKVLINMIREVDERGSFPFRTSIVKEGNYYKFT